MKMKPYLYWLLAAAIVLVSALGCPARSADPMQCPGHTLIPLALTVRPSIDERYAALHPPRYPPQARRQRHEGTVILRVLVGIDGLPKEVRIAKSSGYHELDLAAAQTAKHWRYLPGSRGGRFCEGWVTLKQPFLTGPGPYSDTTRSAGR